MAPGAGWEVLAWVLPAAALTCVALAASTWVAPERAGAAVTVVWLVAVFVGLRHHGAGDLARASVAFRPSSQVAAVVVSLIAVAVLARRRQHLDAHTYA